MAKLIKPKLEDVTARDARVRYLNMEGAEKQYNEPGDRNFQLMLPDDVAEAMANAGRPLGLDFGWNVKMTKPGKSFTPEDIASFEPQPFIEVNLSYRYENLAPKVVMIANGVQTLLNADTVFLIDQAEIVRFDCTINASYWEGLGGKKGFKAYLKEAYVTIRESELAADYAHIPIAGTTRIGA